MIIPKLHRTNPIITVGSNVERALGVFLVAQIAFGVAPA